MKQALHSEAELMERAERLLTLCEADQVEVVIYGSRSDLTRFANSVIHQNMSEEDISVSVRAVLGKKVGCAKTNSLEEEALQRVAKRAGEVTALQPENPDFVSLPEPEPIPKVSAFDPATAECSPGERAEAVEKVISVTQRQGLKAFGTVATQALCLAVANSLGVRTFHRATAAAATALISDETSSGWADEKATRLSDLQMEEIAQTAAKKCLDSRNPVEIEPGDYAVVLEENAVDDLFTFLAYVGLGALAYQEGTSFMVDKMEQRVASELVTLWDDGLDARGIPFPFDFEGVPKQKVALLEKGVAKNVVYDSYTANRVGKKSTGHALPAPNEFGPFPTNMFVMPGDSKKEEMIASIERGLLVTRFHYTNVVHPKLTIITGMTRDGTFLIEEGKLTKGVKNLRFMQSILEALEKVSMVGDKGVLKEYCWVPALKIDSFHFSGVTEF